MAARAGIRDLSGIFGARRNDQMVSSRWKATKLNMAANYGLKAARVLKGFTQLQLAEKVGLQEHEVSRLETGRIEADSDLPRCWKGRRLNCSTTEEARMTATKANNPNELAAAVSAGDAGKTAWRGRELPGRT
jgi:DNA-binding XRE family transcriptional regulator